jgi:Raf kinase inhibitor-like YbhB/YbcL family protein
MRLTLWHSLGSSALVLAFGLLPAAAQQPPAAPATPPLMMTSSAFRDGGEIPVKYSCAAKPAAVSIPLQWSNVPKGTVTFTLIFHDPDANPQKGSMDVTHWIVWNMPATLTQLPEGIPANPSMPDGTVQGKNIRGVNGYQGPCPPPSKPHHYTFELYALDTKLDLGPDASRADVLQAMNGHIIGKAVYVGFFHQ